MIRQPCNFCGARGGKKHAGDCGRPGHVPKVTELVASKHPTARPQDVLRNRIAIAIDSSTSMHQWRQDVPRVINEQIAEIKKNAAKTGQPTSLTLYSFADQATLLRHYEDVFECRSFDSYSPMGNTALFDAVGLSILNFQASPVIDDPNTSFLVIAITDGENNRSSDNSPTNRFNQRTLNDLMSRVTATDRWTFVFSVPRGKRHALAAFGIPQGNIQEWEQTLVGLNTMMAATVTGLGSYYGSRAAGMTRSVNFFSPDLAQVPKRAIQRLDDQSRSFHVWNVDRESPIREFVETKLSDQPGLAKNVGGNYQIGRGYYQLTKSEEVQAAKDMVLLDKNTNAIYGGQQARELIGCPMGLSFKIRPGNHANYEIFIKSTSVNRKLVPGTKVLYYLG